MIAAITEGHVDLADVLFLVAFILCCVAFVLRLMVKAVDSALMSAAVACIALAFFVL